MEKHYAFIKDNRVIQIAVFSEEDTELANRIVLEKGYDSAVWVDTTPPPMYSYWDGISFEQPTREYLIDIGVIIPDVKEPPIQEEEQVVN